MRVPLKYLLYPILSLSALHATVAFAQSSRTFVSGKGSDTGTCTVTAPCRSFAYAVQQTAPGGELVVLDSAGYGTVTITQSMSIVNDGAGTASIALPPNGTAIAINAGQYDEVTLRGIDVQGSNSGTAINVQNVGILDVINCTLNLGNYGVNAGTLPANTIINIVGSKITNMSQGVLVQGTGSGPALVNIRNDDLLYNDIGLNISDTSVTSNSNTANLVIDKSDIAGGEYGAILSSLKNVLISESTFSGETQTAIQVINNTTAYIDRTKISGNATGLAAPDGTGILYSYGNNVIRGNTSNGSAPTKVTGD